MSSEDPHVNSPLLSRSLTPCHPPLYEAAFLLPVKLKLRVVRDHWLVECTSGSTSQEGGHEWGITVHFSVMTRLCSAFNGEREWHNRRSKAVNAFLWGMDDFVWNVSSLSSATDV